MHLGSQVMAITIYQGQILQQGVGDARDRRSTVDRPIVAVLESHALYVIHLPQVEKSCKCSSLPFSVELDIVDISHCQKAQPVLDRHEVAWGAIFVLARGVTHGMWTFQDIMEHRLRKRKVTNAQWKRHQNFGICFIRLKHHELYGIRRLEYDQEQLAIIKRKGHGFGPMGSWE
ncbi:hypothetical protein C8R48DRAFT_673958 [Suillus tomentosus]|nr:hypothetical protein C8R48DRAFT_680492 [Suillus tomentosus]KAG1859416.1 hypothetical protein C8R48DRAFT_673958 [Suillus tomentosus]